MYKAKAKDNKPPSAMPEVEPFVVYGWLLKDSQQKQVRAWTDAIIANSGQLVLSSHALGPDDSGPKAKKQKTNATEALVDGLFA